MVTYLQVFDVKHNGAANKESVSEEEVVFGVPIRWTHARTRPKKERQKALPISSKHAKQARRDVFVRTQPPRCKGQAAVGAPNEWWRCKRVYYHIF